MVKLSIIVINYNTKDLTLNCVRSIEEQYEKELNENQIEVVLIDNGSTDESGAEIAELLRDHRGIKVVESMENLGFGKGNNEAVKSSKGEILLFLNSDTEVLDKGLLRMIEFVENNKKVGVLGGRLKNIDGTNQKSAVKFYNPFNLFLMLLGFERLGLLRKSPKRISKVDWVSGAALMIKKKLFEDLGGFDKNIFMYMEDMELCFRVNKAGFDVYFFPDVNILHKERGSGNKTSAILNIYKGILYFYKTHKTNFEYNSARHILKTKAVILKNLGVLLNNAYLKKTYGEALEILKK